jgi:hypothetical protein
MKVRVWNDNTYPHTEMFKGDRIHIPAKQYVEMEFYEAHEFKGQYTAIKRDFDGNPVPESYKMIRIEKIEGAAAQDAPKVSCQACGKSFLSQHDLDDHIDAEHLDQISDPEVAQKRRGRPRKEVA